MRSKTVLVIGAGGLGREVAWMVREIETATGAVAFGGFVVSDSSFAPPSTDRAPYCGDFTWLRAHRGEFSALAMGIGAPETRLRLAAELADFGPEFWPALVSPDCRLDRQSCSIATGAILCAGTILTVDVTIAPFALVNMGCTLGHGVSVGEGSALAPGVHVSGEVKIGRGVMVGTGAKILENLTIGDGARVSAGALVNRDVAAGEVIVAAPAFRLRREWSGEE